MSIFIPYRDQLNQLFGNLGFGGQRQYFVAAGPDDGEGIVITVEAHVAARYVVGGDHIQFLVDQFPFRVGHYVLGLGSETHGEGAFFVPGDGRDGARRTAELLAEVGCAGVKVHNLMVLERTILAAWWREGRVDVLDHETYVAWLADFVERLAPEQVLHRITGDAPLEERLAPRWDVHKNAIRDLLDKELARRGTRQGSLVGKGA